MEPEKHLAGYELFCNEPHRFANNSGSVFWDGDGDSLYKLMAQNFMAEVPEFFMKSKSFTSIVSSPSNDPNVGSIGAADVGKKYMMRIKMYKSQDQATLPQISGSLVGTFTPPQYPDTSKETFTMYSRPSAFGPPKKLMVLHSCLFLLRAAIILLPLLITMDRLGVIFFLNQQRKENIPFKKLLVPLL